MTNLIKNPLLEALQKTLDPTNRKNAENQLLSMEGNISFSIDLLTIVQDASIDYSIRFASAVYFKNFIKRKYQVLKIDVGRFHQGK
jgi:exportin-2 (importin alpha re-exporter)